MKKFNFAAPKIYRELFSPGKLTELAAEIYSGQNRKTYKGLTPDELVRVPTLYSSFNPTETPILELEDEKVYRTKYDKEVLGKDIKAITMLMYDKPRTAYVDFGKIKQGRESLYSGATPLALLGYKRFWRLNYNRFRDLFTGYATLNDKWEIVEHKSDALERAFKLDILLGQTYASTRFDPTTEEIVWNEKGLGLLLLSTVGGEGFKPNFETIDYLRVRGIGNYAGTFATAYGACSVDNSLDSKVDNDVVKLYNHASQPMKLLMSQRWAWYGMHRNDDMICDFQDWEVQTKKRDTLSNVFTGLKPQEGCAPTGIGAKFGIGL